MLNIEKSIDGLNKRIYELRTALDLSQESFGTKIGVTRSAVSNYESGGRNITDRTILIICREFNVNEEWLKEGKGDMFVDVLPEDELAAYCAQICAGTDDFISSAILEYMHLDEESKIVIKELVRSIGERMTKREAGE
ncbi:helix-turn-helix domain-containing protein [Eubacterium limosum]|uniref:helix-turn-helix domain-containing protein n=1 Tax=Eubacterium limosum TaxID=1736 RepID=UPI0010631223|nr:helix-turn-helix transcriptional regulator [Eubacterium limosum]